MKARGFRKPITIAGVTYPTHKAAALALRIPYQTFMARKWKKQPLTKPVRPWGVGKL